MKEKKGSIYFRIAEIPSETEMAEKPFEKKEEERLRKKEETKILQWDA